MAMKPKSAKPTLMPLSRERREHLQSNQGIRMDVSRDASRNLRQSRKAGLSRQASPEETTMSKAFQELDSYITLQPRMADMLFMTAHLNKSLQVGMVSYNYNIELQKLKDHITFEGIIKTGNLDIKKCQATDALPRERVARPATRNLQARVPVPQSMRHQVQKVLRNGF